MAQRSELGIDLGLSLTLSGDLKRNVISGVGTADDVGLISSDLKKLRALLHLTKMYCDKFQVKLVGDKTKLLVFTNKQCDMEAKVQLAVTNIEVDGFIVSPSPQAGHVGVMKSPDGFGPNIAA